MPVVHDFAQYRVTCADRWWYQGYLQGLEPAHIMYVGQLVCRIHTVAQSMGFIRPSIVKWKHGFKLTDFNLVL